MADVIPADARDQLFDNLAALKPPLAARRIEELADAALTVMRGWLAGHTVIDLPEPDGVTARELLQTHDADDLRGAECEALQYLANLRGARRRLASESSGDGESRG